MSMPIFPSPLSPSNRSNLEQTLENAIRDLGAILAKLEIAALRGGDHRSCNEDACKTVKLCLTTCQEIQKPTPAPVFDAGSSTPTGP